MTKNNYTLAKKLEKDVWYCPSCKQIIPIEEYPATSRRDNETEICSACGTKEALEDFVNR